MNTPAFPTVTFMLRTVFNAEDGLSEEQSIRLYLRAAARDGNRGKLEMELTEAFSRPEVCWRRLLHNDDYEVVDLDREAAAREHARRILWAPLFSAA